ncbi:sensor histidine kinase [Thermocoleostomius sinensis]|uniref:histidine kinase n=1 Tax=Thermocoleostomius sinensis A174 TaxID=2016057 RepID=A0A9E9CAT9_9CYAN|nr:GAF domain-containing sensor histidine kinase [Thermocoleostomius sinensis]WAL61427.1 GAF domain-containing sensor histidine kinase [Thermocoleostomius sinensis A174]
MVRSHSQRMGSSRVAKSQACASDLEDGLPDDAVQGDWWERGLETHFANTLQLVTCCLRVDEQLRCVQASTAAAAITGLPIESHLNAALRDLFPHWSSTLEYCCQQVLKTKESVVNIALADEFVAENSTVEPPTDRRTWCVSCFFVAAPCPAVTVLLVETKPDQQATLDSHLKQIDRTRSITSGLVCNLPCNEMEFRDVASAEAELSDDLADDLVATAHLSPDLSPDLITLETLQQQFERERIINKIAMRILQSLELQEILDTTVTELRQFLHADRVIISQRSDEDQYTVVAESVSDEWPNCLGSLIRDPWLQSHLCLECLEHQPTKLIIDDLQSLPVSDEVRTWVNSLQVKSRLAIPIGFGEQLWGILSVHHCSAIHQWEPFEIELSEKLATQLAIAIQQSELHQQIQRLNDELENQVATRTAELQVAFEFEATLKRITDRVRDSLDEDQILQAAVRELALVLRISGCNASLYDLEQGTSTTCYEYTNSISPYQGRVSKFSAAAELYDQLLRGQYFQFCSLVPNPERGVVSMLACPILDDQEVIGDLWLIHHKSYAFTDQDIRLAQQVANQCAIAIRQARLYEKSQAQVKELERLNQLKDDFLSTVSHELRTPLSNIKMAIHMLRTAPTDEKRERYMSILEAECNRETELINDLLDLQKLENDSYCVTMEPIQLLDWLPNVIAPFSSRAQNRQQSLIVEAPEVDLVLMSDQRCLERILAELLNNACKYTPPNGTIVLRILQQPSMAIDESIRPVISFIVSNQANIPTTEIPRIFEKFYRIPKTDPWQQGGTGLGLALVKKLVETLQGTISASSQDGWTALRVDVPMLLAFEP